MKAASDKTAKMEEPTRGEPTTGAFESLPPHAPAAHGDVWPAPSRASIEPPPG